jgi:hypothetical protein
MVLSPPPNGPHDIPKVRPYNDDESTKKPFFTPLMQDAIAKSKILEQRLESTITAKYVGGNVSIYVWRFWEKEYDILKAIDMYPFAEQQIAQITADASLDVNNWLNDWTELRAEYLESFAGTGIIDDVTAMAWIDSFTSRFENWLSLYKSDPIAQLGELKAVTLP